MYISLLVFVTGASVMVLEIVGSRFFAPYIGTTLTVWTMLIGMVMAGLSVGYMIGGRLGDRWNNLERLQLIAGLAGFWVLLIAIWRDSFFFILMSFTQSITLVTFIGTGILLVFPSILLGSVSPYAIALSAKDIHRVGATAGRLSALSTIGSILGTFLAGFALVPTMGTTTILITLSITLVIVSILRPTLKTVFLSLIFICALTFSVYALPKINHELSDAQNIVYKTDTPYSAITVQRFTHINGKDFVALKIDNGFHSARFIKDNPAIERGYDYEDGHVFEYTPFYALTDSIIPDAKRALLIGGGAHTLAMDFLDRHPNGTVDIVEIDPIVTQVAETFFGSSDARIQTIHEDARMFVNRQGPIENPRIYTNTYDIILGDAAQSTGDVPFHLVTLEATKKIASLLRENGIYMLNFPADLTKKSGENLKAELATLKKVFPSIIVFEVPNDHTQTNYLLLASTQRISINDFLQTPNQHIRELATHHIDLPESEYILTDNFAPVEQIHL
jgi:spermidine synthase